MDENTGLQKLGKRNEKLWKRVTVLSNDWNSQSNAEKWRSSWADMCNQYIAPENQIDHRSFKRQGIERIPTIHEGYAARQMERRGIVSERMAEPNHFQTERYCFGNRKKADGTKGQFNESEDALWRKKYCKTNFQYWKRCSHL